MLGIQGRRVIRCGLLSCEAVRIVCLELYGLVLELVVSLLHHLLVFELHVLRASMLSTALHIGVWHLVVREAIRRMRLVRSASYRSLRNGCILLVERSALGH